MLYYFYTNKDSFLLSMFDILFVLTLKTKFDENSVPSYQGKLYLHDMMTIFSREKMYIYNVSTVFTESIQNFW